MPYKRPESVLVVIYTFAFEVLLMQRCDVPIFWQSVTGSLRDGETPLQAAQREVWEETGLQMQEESFHDCHQQNRFEIKPPWRSRYDPAITHNLEHVFTLALPTRLPIQLHPTEHSHYDWRPREQAAAQASSYTNREAILKWVV